MASHIPKEFPFSHPLPPAASALQTSKWRPPGPPALLLSESAEPVRERHPEAPAYSATPYALCPTPSTTQNGWNNTPHSPQATHHLRCLNLSLKTVRNKTTTRTEAIRHKSLAFTPENVSPPPPTSAYFPLFSEEEVPNGVKSDPSASTRSESPLIFLRTEVPLGSPNTEGKAPGGFMASHQLRFLTFQSLVSPACSGGRASAGTTETVMGEVTNKLLVAQIHPSPGRTDSTSPDPLWPFCMASRLLHALLGVAVPWAACLLVLYGPPGHAHPVLTSIPSLLTGHLHPSPELSSEFNPICCLQASRYSTSTSNGT